MVKLQAVSPLGHPRESTGAVQFQSPRLQISEAPRTTALSLRPSRKAADTSGVASYLRALGLEMPSTPNGLSGTSSLGCAWLEPRAWLVLSEQALPAGPDSVLSVTDISDRVCLLKVSGAGARDLIAAGCDTSMLSPGRMARTRFGGIVNLIIECHGESHFRLAVDVSFAQPLVTWLIQAASNQA